MLEHYEETEATHDGVDHGEMLPSTPEAGSFLEALNAGDLALESATTQPLTHEQAVMLNETIKSTAEVMYVLVNKAYVGRIWEPLGYKSFKDYVTEELSMSRSRAYQLIDQAQVIEKVRQIAPAGTEIHIREGVARDIKSTIDELVPKIEEGLENLPEDQDPESFIYDMIEESRQNNKKPAPASAEDRDWESDDNSEPGDPSEGYAYAGGDYMDAPEFPDDGQAGDPDAAFILDGEDEGDYDDLFDSDEMRSVQDRLEHTFSLETAVSSLVSLPSPEKMVEYLSGDTKNHTLRLVEKAHQWFTQFHAELIKQEWFTALNEENTKHTTLEEMSEFLKTLPELAPEYEEENPE